MINSNNYTPRANRSAERTATANIILAYTQEVVDELEADEAPIALLAAILDSQTADETCHLARALVARHNALAKPPYRTTGDSCEPRLAEINARLNGRSRRRP